MSPHPIEEELERLERDVRALANDADETTATVRDEVVAAEYIATEETLENVGTVLDALTRLHEVQRKFWEDFLADHRQTFEAFSTSRSPTDLLKVGVDHWNRRAAHVGDAIGATIRVAANGAQSINNTFSEVWKPFEALVRRDMRR